MVSLFGGALYEIAPARASRDADGAHAPHGMGRAERGYATIRAIYGQGSFSKEAGRKAARGHGLRAHAELLLHRHGRREVGRGHPCDAGLPHGRRLDPAPAVASVRFPVRSRHIPRRHRARRPVPRRDRAEERRRLQLPRDDGRKRSAENQAPPRVARRAALRMDHVPPPHAGVGGRGQTAHSAFVC